jgi:hypothetical protein
MTESTWRDVEQLANEIEELQARKVIELAQRLRPGLTAEDIRNPHDFPELGDSDWQFEDGVLAGIQTVLMAIRAKRRELETGAPGRAQAGEDTASESDRLGGADRQNRGRTA